MLRNVLKSGFMVIFVLTSLSRGVTATAEKTIVWEFRSNDITWMVGNFNVGANACAFCTHDTSQDPATVSKANTWLVETGLPLSSSTTATATNIGGHPSEANSTMSAQAWSAQNLGGPNPPKYVVLGTLKGDGMANAQSSWTQTPCTATAGFQGNAGMTIAGAKVIGSSLKWQKNNVNQKLEGSSGGTGKELKITISNAQDPITVTLTELETGLVYTEELFRVDANGQASGADASYNWNWDWESGVSLSALQDAFVSINGAANSSWLDNPYGEFGASLIDGVFTATGAWLGLPWALTYDGADVIEATLAAAYMPLELDYTVPEALITDDSYTYQQDLDWSGSFEGKEVETTPEPTTILLLGLGSLGLLRKRRA